MIAPTVLALLRSGRTEARPKRVPSDPRRIEPRRGGDPLHDSRDGSIAQRASV